MGIMMSDKPWFVERVVKAFGFFGHCLSFLHYECERIRGSGQDSLSREPGGRPAISSQQRATQGKGSTRLFASENRDLPEILC